MFTAERLNPDAEMSVYLDGELVHEKTVAAWNRPLMPQNFPFRVDVSELAAPGTAYELVLKFNYLRPRSGRTFYPFALVNTNVEPVAPTEGGLIVFAGAIAAQRRGGRP